MKLTSMERTKAEKQEAEANMKPLAISGEDYPYGLCIRLGNEELKKLGITTLPAVGESFMLMASAKVKSVSSSEYSEGDKRRDMELQITDLALARSEERNAADTMYPAKKD